MDLRSDRYWWDALSDEALLEALTVAGVQLVVARNLVSRRTVEAARVRLELELGTDR